jgi:hypothetical protein
MPKLPHRPEAIERTPPTVAEALTPPSGNIFADAFPEPVAVEHKPPETLELAPSEPAIVKELAPVKVDVTTLHKLTREQLLDHLRGIRAAFKQPEEHVQQERPRPTLTPRQREQLELETARGKQMVQQHAEQQAMFKMPPRTEVVSGITKGPVIEPHIQPVGRTEDQKFYVPDPFKKQGHNLAQPLPEAKGAISGV